MQFGFLYHTIQYPILYHSIPYRTHLSFFYSGQDLDGSTAGIAFVGALCHTSGVAVTQDGHHSVGVVFTHELGHLFGMDHDDSPSEC